MIHETVILALDDLDLEQCLALVSEVGKRVYAIKIHSLYDECGPSVVKKLIDAGARRVWVDAKLHDIPRTVQLRALAIANADAAILSVHAAGGIEMMKEATLVSGELQVYAITVLTSLSEEQAHLTFGQPSKAAALSFARLAKFAGVHGVVCSPQEVGILSTCPELEGLEFITPGVRSASAATHDQKRVGTPAQALKDGATRVVIGRQITQASDPFAALNELEAELTNQK